MTSAALTPLPDLPKGYQFPETTFELTAERIERYVAAIDDANAIYHDRGLAPPLAVAAFGLGSLLDLVELPGGSLHTGQEMEARASVAIPATLVLSGSIVQRSERRGLVISVIKFEVTSAGASEPAILGRTTVVAPKDEGAGA